MSELMMGLPIAHLNIRGLCNKVDEIRLHIAKHNLKILHLSETFLTSNLDSQMLFIPDFSIVRRDRDGRHGGGVLTYIHSTVNYSVLSHLEDTLSESLSILVTHPSSKPFITSVIYRPPSSPVGWLDQFTSYYTKCKVVCDEIILLGDFNFNLNVINTKWTDLIDQLGLLQLIQQSTRVQPRSESLLDHIYVNKPVNIHRHGIIDLGLSDHCMIFLTRKLGTRTSSPKCRNKFTFYDWKNFSPELFQYDLKFTSWGEIYNAVNAESMLHVFNTKLQSIVSLHLKIKTRFVKSSIIPPWLDQEAQHSIRQRDFFKKNKRWSEYKKQRNFTNNLIRKKKRQHVANLISQADGKQTKHLWNVLRNSQHSSILPDAPLSLDVDPLMAVANSLNNHFVNIVDSLSSDSSTNTTFSSSDRNIDPTENIAKISTNDVILFFKSIDIKKATGYDRLSVRILRIALPFIIDIITDIINVAIAECSFPSQWKIAVVTPLHKGGNPNTLTNYRPISVLPILSKIYEKHILSALHLHLDKHNIISNSQSGFRKKHSCSSAMHHLYSTWSDEIRCKKLLLLIFLDFRKAFDLVNHEILLTKLKRLGITGNFHNIFKSFLSNRTQCVKVGKSFSEMLPISSGVPQGAILSPTLFQIYINDLLSLPLYCKVHAYADDTTFYVSSDGSKKVQQLIDSDMSRIQCWCRTNKMEINVSKSHYLLLNAANSSIITIKVGDKQIERRSSTKLLGFVLNDSLNWQSHIAHISSKVSSNLRLFYNLRHLLNFTSSMHFYNNFIHPYLLYGIHLYYSMSPALHTDSLYILQKKALRLICLDRTLPKDRTLSNKFVVEKNICSAFASVSRVFFFSVWVSNS